jgi:hypothetical protein
VEDGQFLGRETSNSRRAMLHGVGLSSINGGSTPTVRTGRRCEALLHFRRRSIVPRHSFD